MVVLIFINRETELLELENIAKLSEKRLFTTLIYGPRRVGKTELVKHASKSMPFLYFFVYEGKTKESLLKEFETELKEKGCIDKDVEIRDFDSFIRLLFRACENTRIIFDEVQYMNRVYPAFFSVLQREIDENQQKKMHFVFLGSITGLIKKVFEDSKAPLYGRMKSSINLKPLTYKNVRVFLKKLKYDNEEDFIKFYSVFGGFPKYYTAMQDFGLEGKKFDEVIRYLFFRDNAPLRNEVIFILRSEFGAGKSYYYNILEAIATSHTKFSEIASFMGKNPTAITSFMDDAVNYYELIERLVPVTHKKTKSRNTSYVIKNPLFRFWFRYIYPHLSYFENGDYEYVLKKVDLTINSFFGKGFETVCQEALKELNGRKKLPFVFHKSGSEWGKDTNRNAFEIDTVAFNESTKEILFCECKWKEKVNAKKILAELKEKAKFVLWNNNGRKEHYVLFAKSFKEKIEEPGVMLFDLKDLKNCFEG